LGYKIEIIKGILFDKDYIFTDYIDFCKCYDMKKNSVKNTPDYTIAKLFLNTLYGKFGMKPVLDSHKIIDNDQIDFYLDNYNIKEFIDLKNDKSLIVYSLPNIVDDDKFINKKWQKVPNISVAISAFITANARLHMSQFKNNPNFNLYYSDTDSIDIDKPLPDDLVGKELGQMKLEHHFTEAVYLAPKVYGSQFVNKEEKIEDLVKVKGLKDPISFEEIKYLLNKESIKKIEQDK
jgi:hypothetical protein